MIKLIATHNLFRLVVTGVFVLMVTGTATAQVPQCSEFPKSEFWSNVSHDSIISYVQRKHSGDWKEYVIKWQKQLDSMTKIQERDGSAFFKSKNLSINGEELAQYVKDLEARVEVTKCLATWQN